MTLHQGINVVTPDIGPRLPRPYYLLGVYEPLLDILLRHAEQACFPELGTAESTPIVCLLAETGGPLANPGL